MAAVAVDGADVLVASAGSAQPRARLGLAPLGIGVARLGIATEAGDEVGERFA